MAILPPHEVVALLRQRLALLEGRISARRDILAGDVQHVRRLFLIEDEYDLALQEAEAVWVRSLLGELETETFPDLAEWRAFHRENLE